MKGLACVEHKVSESVGLLTAYYNVNTGCHKNNIKAYDKTGRNMRKLNVYS